MIIEPCTICGQDTACSVTEIPKCMDCKHKDGELPKPWEEMTVEEKLSNMDSRIRQLELWNMRF